MLVREKRKRSNKKRERSEGFNDRHVTARTLTSCILGGGV